MLSSFISSASPTSPTLLCPPSGLKTRGRDVRHRPARTLPTRAHFALHHPHAEIACYKPAHAAHLHPYYQQGRPPTRQHDDVASADSPTPRVYRAERRIPSPTHATGARPLTSRCHPHYPARPRSPYVHARQPLCARPPALMHPPASPTCTLASPTCTSARPTRPPPALMRTSASSAHICQPLARSPAPRARPPGHACPTPAPTPYTSPLTHTPAPKVVCLSVPTSRMLPAPRSLAGARPGSGYARPVPPVHRAQSRLPSWPASVRPEAAYAKTLSVWSDT
ncbi:hypothetical protein FIBSPDRAFT_886320 [Athelia psychrophila]|uniref:Uncharacterized protein n=1 Tax=Athelia psychrophila TaxID=1759441 RepID=A0A166R0P4_9AGAM|nr:hypothetical protein FIBSPDRAFT_886320 [Fibularhizoctonia sp. CBS 109695]